MNDKCMEECKDRYEVTELFKVYQEIRERNLHEVDISIIREVYPSVSKEYIEVCNLLFDTDKPWTDLYTLLRVYDYFNACFTPAGGELPQGVKNFVIGLMHQFPDKKFSKEFLWKVGFIA